MSDFDATVTDDENHGWVFIGVQQGRELLGAPRGVAVFRLCVRVDHQRRRQNLSACSDCQSLDPGVANHRRAALRVRIDDAHLCLVWNCYTRNDRHQYVTGSGHDRAARLRLELERLAHRRRGAASSLGERAAFGPHHGERHRSERPKSRQSPARATAGPAAIAWCGIRRRTASSCKIRRPRGTGSSAASARSKAAASTWARTIRELMMHTVPTFSRARCGEISGRICRRDITCRCANMSRAIWINLSSMRARPRRWIARGKLRSPRREPPGRSIHSGRTLGAVDA